ncbi:MAG TPA: sensor histidine kinase [Thermomicrobiales bacterium]|nr:sensor histidine kinase [Thermomicrobiales bacterium]
MTEILPTTGPVSRLRAWVRGFTRHLSLFHRVVIVNVAIIAVGAVTGTTITLTIGRHSNWASIIPTIIGLMLVAIAVSIVLNVVVLRAAFRPLRALHRTATEVQAGNLEARAPIDPTADPEMRRLATTLNTILNELDEDRTHLRDLASQVIRAQEDERRRISRELHDDTAQILFAQLLQVTSLKSIDTPNVQEIATMLESSTVDAIEGVRRLALELRPPALDDLGLEAAMTELCQRFQTTTGCEIDVQIEGQRTRLPPAIELVLYRVAQEALTNIGKHSRATNVEVRLARSETEADLTVQDNGIGFLPGRYTAGDGVGLGLGLFGMEERATLIGGTLRIESNPGGGTLVAAHVPLGESRLE